MADGDEEGISVDRILRQTAEEPVPPPSPDLIARTLRKVRALILAGDLLRFVTLEALWKSKDGRDDDAAQPQERQDS